MAIERRGERIGRWGAVSFALIGLVWAAAPAPAQAAIDAPVLRRFGGIYAIDCSDAESARLRVDADALRVEHRGKRITARPPVSAYSFFGKRPAPKNFQVAMLADVRGGAQLTFLGFADRRGLWLQLEGDPQVRAALGETLMAARYTRCDARSANALAAPPNRNEPTAPQGPGLAAAPSLPPAPTSPAAPADPTAAEAGVPDLGALSADPAFKRAYLAALGARASERWLARLDGPAPAPREQAFDGTRYVVVAVCKPHDCHDHNAVFLYSATQRRVVGLVQQRGAKALVGAPGPALATRLEALWQREWRQK